MSEARHNRPPEKGDAQSSDELLPLVYQELRKLAGRWLARERPGQTLQATALVHEAFLRLIDAEGSARWDSPGHFFAAAAVAMRRILIEHARRKMRLKHGGGWERLDIELAELPTSMTPEGLVALDEALTELAREDPVKSQIVTMRYFAGMSGEQIAQVLGVSRVTVHRHWVWARAWLHDRLRDEGRER